MFQAMCEHVKTTFNGGVIKPAITIFRQRKKGEQDMRVWNPLFLMHAGYSYPSSSDEDDIGEEPEIKKLGDQGNLEFTRVIAVRKYNQITRIFITNFRKSV